jgi:1-acyl-sn-glycerol-3-phosphate acyltransferase
VVAAAADYFFPNRRRGAVSALVYGAFPVERTKVNRRSADMAADLLVDGWSLVIFPEGGRSPDGWGQEFRGGAAYLSVRTGRPVVPVYLEGTGDVWPKGSRWPHPGRVSVTFGIPLRADEGEDARRLNVRLEAAVAALADERESDWWTARRRAAGSASPSLTGPAASPWRRAWALPGDRAGRRRRPASWPQ